MFMEGNRLDIVCIIPVMVQLGVVTFVMHYRHFMDLLMSAHYGEIIVSRDVVMSRIGGGIVCSRLCFDIAFIVGSVVSVVFVYFLHYWRWSNRHLMNDRSGMGFMVALIDSRLLNVSCFVMNNRHFVNNWSHMIFMMNRMFNDNWLLVIGDFTSIYFLQYRLLMRLSNFMVCSCVINIM